MNAGAGDGFVYVATGPAYLREAAASAASLRRFHPDTPICLITDVPPVEAFWDDLVVLEQPCRGFRDKLEMHRAPYDRCVFLDTDTTICGDLSQLFILLRQFDVCGVQAAEGQDYTMPDGIPAAFPEMNSGVIGFRRGAATAEFFVLWASRYEEYRALNRNGHYHYANVGDQKSLRAALWHSRVRYVSIGAEFNFIPFRTELASMPVAVLHTRTTADLHPLASRLNARFGRRAYVPSLDVVVMDAMPDRELPHLAFATCRLLFRAAGRRIIPRALRNWLRSQRGVIGWLFGRRYESRSTPSETKWESPPKSDCVSETKEPK